MPDHTACRWHRQSHPLKHVQAILPAIPRHLRFCESPLILYGVAILLPQHQRLLQLQWRPLQLRCEGPAFWFPDLQGPHVQTAVAGALRFKPKPFAADMNPPSLSSRRRRKDSIGQRRTQKGNELLVSGRLLRVTDAGRGHRRPWAFIEPQAQSAFVLCNAAHLASNPLAARLSSCVHNGTA